MPLLAPAESEQLDERDSKNGRINGKTQRGKTGGRNSKLILDSGTRVDYALMM